MCFNERGVRLRPCFMHGWVDLPVQIICLGDLLDLHKQASLSFETSSTELGRTTYALSSEIRRANVSTILRDQFESAAHGVREA